MIATRGNELHRMTTTEAGIIDRCSFARLVALHCRLSGHEPEPRDLDQRLAAAWPMIEDEGMEPGRWARAYLLAVEW